jgi:hypothetical protein
MQPLDIAVGHRDQANARSQSYWSSAIRMAWTKSTSDIIETGKLLLQAREELDRNVFNAMKLPFKLRTRQRLMAIAEHSVLSDATHVSHLPPSWGTLYELSRIPAEILLAKIEDGSVHPGMERKDVAALLNNNSPKQAAEKPSVEASLQSMWPKASAQEKTAFCDAVGVCGFSAVWSPKFYRELSDRIRMARIEADPNLKITTILWTALSHLRSIDEPGSTEIVRKANTNALLAALRTLNKAVRAASNKEVALSLVEAGTLNKIRERLKKKRAA